MSNLWKRWGVLALAAMLMLSLAACGGGGNEKDVATYIQGRMEAYYLGQANEEYMNLMEYSEEDIHEQYNMNVQAEAERMLGFMDVKTDNKNVMDGVRAEAESLVKDIYAKCKFTVGDTNKLKNGSFTTEVTVEPIELMYLITNEDIDEIFSEILEEANCVTQEDYNNLTDAEYEDLEIQYGLAVLDRIRGHLANASYGTPQPMQVQMKLDEEDNSYAIVEDSWMSMDDKIIDYYGDYRS